MENKLKSRDVFYGIIAIATLIVAIIGATLAYFSITANSAEGAVNARAATVSVNYQDGQQISAAADKLVPATFDVVKRAYAKVLEGSPDEETNLCIDDENKQVCSIYRFSVSSDVTREITAKLNNEHNKFTYLHYAVYDVANNEWISLGEEDYKQMFKCDNTNKNEEEELITTDDCFVEGDATHEKTYVNDVPGGSGYTAVNSLFGLDNSSSPMKYQSIEIALQENLMLYYL